MNKLMIVAIISIITIAGLFSQDDYLNGSEYHLFWDWKDKTGEYYGPAKAVFNNGILNIHLGENQIDSKEYKFSWKYTIKKRDRLSFLSTNNGEWLILPYDKKAIVFLNNQYTWTAYSSVYIYEGWIEDYTTISATSTLIEKGIKYNAENLTNGKLPWVSGNGYGVGDKLTLVGSSRKRPLLMLNGFISFDKPYLYTQNSRVKRIRIQSLETGKSKEVVIIDMPEFQNIDIKDLFVDQKIPSKAETSLTIEILEVYPGEKYKDLCITMLVPDFTYRE